MQPVIRQAAKTRSRLAEGPLWDVQTQSLYWVDSMSGIINRLDAQGRETQWSLPGRFIGSMALRREGGAIVTLNDGFYAFDFGTGGATPIALPEKGNDKVRFNDGKVDRQGRFLAGTVVRPGHDAPMGRLFSLSPQLALTELEKDIHISNGPCFSPDGRTFYFTDTLQHQIWAYDYDTETGTPRNKRVLLEAKPLGSITDGCTVDADGCVWTALVMTGRIARVTPQGKVDRIVEMPVPHPTSMMFGGADLRTLYVTSVSESESGRFKTTDAASGCVFAVEGLGVQGLAETRFAG